MFNVFVCFKKQEEIYLKSFQSFSPCNSGYQCYYFLVNASSFVTHITMYFIILSLFYIKYSILYALFLPLFWLICLGGPFSLYIELFILVEQLKEVSLLFPLQPPKEVLSTQVGYIALSFLNGWEDNEFLMKINLSTSRVCAVYFIDVKN